MTKEEIKGKSNDKVKAVEVLLKQLNITIEAKQIITKEGIIENAVFYKDNENYPIDEVKPTPVVEEKKNV